MPRNGGPRDDEVSRRRPFDILRLQGLEETGRTMADDARMEVRGRWEDLSATGAGTRMGKLLRRYWWPIAGASELDREATKPVRLMGEDLVLYKDLGGRYGLLDRHCR